ncbi:MAG: DUF5666 domain-containing protein [Candidatus Saccharimonadales bacterium]
MADKKKSEDERVEETEVVESIDETNTKHLPVERVITSSTPWPLITVGAVTLIVVLALIATSWLMIAVHSSNVMSRNDAMFGRTLQQNGDGRVFSRGGDNFGGRRGFAEGATKGVITAIDGNTLTVSGNGKQVTVKKTSSTVVGGNNTTLAINDSVIIIGNAGDDGVITATHIMVHNQTSGRSMNEDSNTSINQAPGV